jgi:hypothetical protein
MQSQQIRRLLPRTVTPVSLRYPQLLWVLMRISPARCDRRHQNAWRAGSDRAVRVNDAPTGKRILHRSGTAAGVAAAPFINSKPQCGLRRRSETPLSVAAASCEPDDGDVMGGLFDKREMAPCAF